MSPDTIALMVTAITAGGAFLTAVASRRKVAAEATTIWATIDAGRLERMEADIARLGALEEQLRGRIADLERALREYQDGAWRLSRQLRENGLEPIWAPEDI